MLTKIKNIAKDAAKGVKRFMDERIEVVKDIFNNANKRIITGIILIGLGGGLIVSGYVEKTF